MQKPGSESRLQTWNLLNRFSSKLLPMLSAVFVLFVILEVVESGSLVKTLPGFDGDLPFTLETGYVGVGESDDMQLFYYLFESERNPEEDPLMLWLTGGPGCSGPLTFNYANSTSEKAILEMNPHRWTKVASIIFLDQPAGTGFSYAKTPESYITNDTSSAMDTYNCLRKWLVDHPKYINNPLYVGGDSYAGLLVPMIVQEIYDGNEAGEGPFINIKGYVVGNPFTDTSSDLNSRIPYAHNMALLSSEIYKSVHENCHGEYLNVDPNNSMCVHDLDLVDKCLARICTFHILEPYCDSTNTLTSDVFRRGLGAVDISYLPQIQSQWCRKDNYLYCAVWANSKEVREALHIREEFGDIKWVRCNETLKSGISYTHNVMSVVSNHRNLTDKNCRALIYSGDHDMVIPYLSTLSWIESLKLPVIDDWRPWFVDEQVSGYTMKYARYDYNLTFATVKGGGHTAPEFKPKQCLDMFTRWLDKNTL